MKISFDLDGVITNSHHWFLALLDIYRKVDEKTLSKAQNNYYSSLSLLHHPGLFLAKGDKGFIVTARKPESREVTMSWLRKYGITLPVIFVDKKDKIDWQSSHIDASTEAALLKAGALKKLGIEMHFDNNPTIVRVLRKKLPKARIILIGGEEEVPE